MLPIGEFIPAGVAKYKAKVGIPTIEATCIAPESLPIKPSHKLKIAAILSNEVYGIIGFSFSIEDILSDISFSFGVVINKVMALYLFDK